MTLFYIHALSLTPQKNKLLQTIEVWSDYFIFEIKMDAPFLQKMQVHFWVKWRSDDHENFQTFYVVASWH